MYLRTNNQIWRMDGKNCFLEITRDRFFEGKVKFSFQTYDTTKEKGNKIVNKVDFFLKFDDALTFAYECIDGTFREALKKDRQSLFNKVKKDGKNAKHFSSNIREYWRGTSADKSIRSDGKAESRTLSLAPGYYPVDRVLNPEKYKNKAPNDFVLTVKRGPGRETEQGLISPDGPEEVKISIPFPAVGGMNVDKLKTLGLQLKVAIEGYYSRVEMHEVVNPRPEIYGVKPLKEVIQVGDVAEFEILTTSNVTSVEAYIVKGDVRKEIKSDVPMIQTPTNRPDQLRWIFKKKTSVAAIQDFNFVAYAGNERMDYFRWSRITVKNK